MKLLFVDDQEDIRLIGTMALEEAFEVVVASDGLEALEAARRGRPDAIIADVEMPGLDGPGLLARLRAEPDLASIPFLFLTGHAASADRARLLRLGARGVLVKPFDPASFSEEIRRALGA